MSTEQRMVFEIPPPGGASSETPVEQFAHRRRGGPASGIFRGIDLTPVGEAHSARRSAAALAAVFSDPDRSDEQNALIEAAAAASGSTYTQADERLRREAFAEGEEQLPAESEDDELHDRVRAFRREHPEKSYQEALDLIEAGEGSR